MRLEIRRARRSVALFHGFVPRTTLNTFRFCAGTVASPAQVMRKGTRRRHVGLVVRMAVLWTAVGNVAVLRQLLGHQRRRNLVRPVTQLLVHEYPRPGAPRTSARGRRRRRHGAGNVHG